MTVQTKPEDAPQAASRDDSLTNSKGHAGDSIFKVLSVGSGILILVILATVALFLIQQAMPALTNPDELPHSSKNFFDYVAPYLFGTVWVSFLALLFAVPVAVGIALFISLYAPKRLATPVAFVIDLLAAIPSVVYGLWGAVTLAQLLREPYFWLNENLAFIPLFAGKPSGTGRTMLTAALVLAIMILPIITSLSREVFLRTPGLQKEASLALGATRWEMIKQVVFPFGRSGVVAAAMLGLGRALGETMAVAMVLSNSRNITFKLLTSENPNTIAGHIAMDFAESNQMEVSQLIAAGLVLFVLTFVVNMLGRAITGDRRPKGSNPRAGKEDKK